VARSESQKSPKHQHHTSFETLKYLQHSFEISYLGENVVINLLQQKLLKISPFLWANKVFKITMSFQK